MHEVGTLGPRSRTKMTLDQRARAIADLAGPGAARGKERQDRVYQLARKMLGEVAEDCLPFVAGWAAKYQADNHMPGLHPIHYDLMRYLGARMEGFRRAPE